MGGVWGGLSVACLIVRMAEEVGLNPRDLMKNIPSPSQPWKAPVGVWIREMYRKRQEKAAMKVRRADAAGVSDSEYTARREEPCGG